MTSKQTPTAALESIGSQSKPCAKVFKVGAAVFAILYLINGTGAAAGYAKTLQTGHESSAQILSQTIWVGVTWPVVVHDMMRADPMQRVEARADFNA
jgi:hypothetical protein